MKNKEQFLFIKITRNKEQEIEINVPIHKKNKYLGCCSSKIPVY